MKYQIVSRDDGDCEEFSAAVQMQLNDGWKPLGGITAVVGQYGIVLYQALIKDA